jgi:hypothetical protein
LGKAALGGLLKYDIGARGVTRCFGNFLVRAVYFHFQKEKTMLSSTAFVLGIAIGIAGAVSYFMDRIFQIQRAAHLGAIQRCVGELDRLREDIRKECGDNLYFSVVETTIAGSKVRLQATLSAAEVEWLSIEKANQEKPHA